MRLRYPAVAVLAGLAFSGCGGNSEEAVEQRIARERAEAAQQAKQEAEIKDLQQRLKDAEKKRGGTTTVIKDGGASSGGGSSSGGSSGGGGSPSGALRMFHTPGGRVNCAIYRDGADCSVTGAGSTFTFRRGGGEARVEPGLRLGSSSGSAASWGETIREGSISCEIPLQSASRGITCVDAESGHGFEASKVPARQRLY